MSSEAVVVTITSDTLDERMAELDAFANEEMKSVQDDKAGFQGYENREMDRSEQSDYLSSLSPSLIMNSTPAIGMRLEGSEMPSRFQRKSKAPATIESYSAKAGAWLSFIFRLPDTLAHRLQYQSMPDQASSRRNSLSS